MDLGGDSTGSAGASANREHDRRRTRREQATRARHPLVGGLLLALREPPEHERSWARGARGEEIVAEALAADCRSEVVVLHDRSVPGSRRNIDHIAVAPSGVWVVDTKRYEGKVHVAKPLFGQPRLTIDGRDKSRLVEGLAGQVALVTATVETIAPGTPVRGAFCFVDSDLPLLRTLVIAGFPLLRRRSLVKALNQTGPLGSDETVALAGALASAFPPAWVRPSPPSRPRPPR